MENTRTFSYRLIVFLPHIFVLINQRTGIHCLPIELSISFVYTSIAVATRKSGVFSALKKMRTTIESCSKSSNSTKNCKVHKCVSLIYSLEWRNDKWRSLFFYSITDDRSSLLNKKRKFEYKINNYLHNWSYRLLRMVFRRVIIDFFETF